MRVLAVLLLAGSLQGCTQVGPVRSNGPVDAIKHLKTIQVVASSSLKGRPMGDDASLRLRIERQLRTALPSLQIVQDSGYSQIIFTMVDYVPGCAPHCGEVTYYRNWGAEVTTWIRDSPGNPATMPFAQDGWTRNPFVDPVQVFVRSFAKQRPAS